MYRYLRLWILVPRRRERERVLTLYKVRGMYTIPASRLVVGAGTTFSDFKF